MNNYQRQRELVNPQNPTQIVTIKNVYTDGTMTAETLSGVEITVYGALAVNDKCLIDAVTKEVKRRLPAIAVDTVTIS